MDPLEPQTSHALATGGIKPPLTVLAVIAGHFVGAAVTMAVAWPFIRLAEILG